MTRGMKHLLRTMLESRFRQKDDLRPSINSRPGFSRTTLAMVGYARR